MKKIFLLVPLVFLLSACRLFSPPLIDTPLAPPNAITPEIPSSPTVSPPAPIPADAQAPTLFNIPWDDRSVFRDGLSPAAQDALNAQPGASVYHINLKVADSLLEVSGQEEVRYENRETTPLSELQFRLFPNILGGKMDIQSTRVNNVDVTPGYELQNSVMRIPFSSALDPGKSVVISIDFNVTVPPTVDTNYGIFSGAEGVLAYAHGYPMVVVYNEEGWNTEIPPQSGDVTFNDASFYVVRIDAPENLVMAGSGREIAHTTTAGRQVVTFTNGPARDFYFAGSTNYKKVSEKTGDITVNVYAPAGDHSTAENTARIAREAINIFSSRYAPYPYSELDIVTTPTYALGIEYPGLVALTEKLLSDPAYSDNGYLESTVAHETGHQWFYNLVGDDQLDEPWLDESLTQFVTLQYFSDLYGESGAQGFRNSLNGRWDGVDNEKIPVGMPVRNYTNIEYGAIIYGRGGLFFEALRAEIGADTFDTFMKDYTNTYSWNIATTEGLKMVAEKHCNCDLTPLFKEWIYPE
jgi:hypothetical protein